ncbi:MAG: phage tail tape measure protein, partial [Anaerolineales bacterium]|nr:phage tail tape measure protein [Anaerolineales bacterium]
MADRDLRINIDVKSTGKGEIVELRQEMQRFETGIDELKASIKQAEDAFEAQRATSIALKSEYKQLNREGKGTREMFEDLSQQIEKSQAAELEAIQNTRKLIAELNELDGETGEVAAEFGDLGQRLNEAEGWITGVTQEVRTMGQGFQNVSGDVQEVGSEVREVGQHARRAADGIDKLGDDASRSADQLEKLTGGAVKFSAIGNIIADGVQDAARAVVEFAKESVQAFYDFERSSREIFTLIPGASAEMREALTKDALALGTELGRLPDEILPSIYNALSAGVPQDNVLETVRVASDAARAGVADLDSTLKLGLGILNAQVGGVSNLSDVYDQLFFIVKNGVITLPELNTVMSQVTSIAGEAGVSMQDISAAMITMTRQGDTAAEAAELLSIMLTQLSTAGTTLATVFEEAAGKSFRQFVAEGGTLAEAMQLLQDHANNTGQALGDILGGGSPFFRDTQAARGALELTGKHLEELVKFGEEAEDQLGAMAEAGAEMGEAAELGALQATAAFEEFKIAAGELASEGLAPVYAGLTTTLKLLSGNLGNQVDSMTDDIVEQAKATGDYESAAQRLAKALDTAYSTEGRAFVSDETRADLNNSLNEIYVNLAKNSDSVEEFQAALDALDVSGLYKPANAQELFDAAQAEKFAESLENIDQKMFSVAQHAQELNEQPIEFSPEQLEEMSAGLDRVDEKLFHLAETAVSPSFHEAVVLKEEMIAADEQAAAVAEDRAARIAAAAAEEQAAILANRQAYNQTALAVLNGAEAETIFKDALFQTSAQLGINPGQFR